MTDNFEDIEHQETVHAEDAPAGPRSNLAEAWRTRPIFKLLVIMTVAGAAIALGTTFFSGGNKQQTASHLPAPPESHVAPGGKESPYFIQQTKEAEQQREKEALAKGTSAMPTPMGQSSDISVTDKADPMNELRSETERLKQQLAEIQRVDAQRQTQQVVQQENAQRVAQQAVQQQVASAPSHQQAEQFDPALSQVMQAQMKQLMESWSPKGIKQVEVSKKDTLSADASNNGLSNTSNSSSTNEKVPPIVPAGTVSYAQLLTEANSDVPGPILAQIVSGPLAGARAVGAFQVSRNNDYLVLKFTLADIKGKDYQINALALDPDTTLGGMATEVDDRYFVRLVLPAAAAFLQGFGEELGQTSTTASQSASTTIITQASPGITQGVARGASQAANTAASFFQNEANNTKPLIRVAAGTPMGLFFVSSVFDPAKQQSQQQATSANGCPPGTAPGYSVGGRVVNLPTGQTNGCYPTGGSSAGGIGAAGSTGYAYGVNAAGNAGDATGNNVPYPNYANTSATSGFRGYGSPLGGTAGGFNTFGAGGYGH